LVQAGATSLRLNASHLSPEQVMCHCNALRAALPEVRCIVDLQGKKMRVGAIAPRQLELDAHVVLSNDPNDSEGIYVPHPELFEQVAIGERLSFDDGRIEVLVVARETKRLVARVHRPGLLVERKGLNRVEHPIELIDLTPADQQTILRCNSIDSVDFAVSFASDGTEAAWVRSRAPNRRIILKVERAEAILNLDALAQQADELWICRGDLGAQLGLSNMARQLACIDPRRHEIPMLMAGQVLEHLTQHDQPTRSEVCHLTDLILRGYAGIVLSDETAIGVAPASATRWAAQLMREALAPLQLQNRAPA
jgi:pyruvate kinase